MKILSASHIRDLDKYTIQNEPISSLELMERASLSFVEWLINKFDKINKTIVFCAIGNNGGDGLAISRLLLEREYQVQTFILHDAKSNPTDVEINLKRLKKIILVQDIYNETDIPDIDSDSIVIDAIFGSGLSRPITGIAAQVVHSINQSKATVVAVDIPSGLYVDTYNPNTTIIEADFTVSFQLPKLSFLLPQNARYVGEWHITDIGLHADAIEKARTSYYYTDASIVKSLVKKRDKFSHKGTFGHALLVGGSYGKMGAAILATRSCLRSGIGLLSIHIPACGYEILQTSAPEAMAMVDKEEKLISDIDIPDLTKYTAIGIGPGIGTASQTAEGFKRLLEQASKPLVIDADGLNLLSEHKEWLTLLPEESILTPHPKEFERLAGKTANEYERLDVLKKFCSDYKVNVVLKGAHTAVANAVGDIYFNSTGNPGMATGGSGDVLTGIITSLVAQSYQPFKAAVLGVYFHGLAGDKAAASKGYTALIASDIIDCLPQAFIEFGL
ncbi:NAD(P)H-hydrate dehydratase [Rhodocytophaga rosea]|uniref:Bifunctional NAD(P)H-hydrate repair enzyme n=1 Tax=Rhodocytophaga rosea TaxID=2704465 RepID=A0A6C0GGS8_9BACT|nr:NAD(P)H-hydrate dehydratase [Rhodocytophaga rosea]QHT67167.1 NAD(P)H-hydrate dehydratase [Rhodocytophaga rosea]